MDGDYYTLGERVGTYGTRPQELALSKPAIAWGRLASMRYYITTPIYYVNGEPHLGHAYTTIAADILARYHRQRGDEVFFLTGTDEHGNKMAQAAEERGLTPREHWTRWRRSSGPRGQLDASNDFFIRTTDPEHEAFVQGFVEKLRAAGDIEKRTYGGLYCTACEGFWYERDLGTASAPTMASSRLARGGELLLPPQQVPGPAVEHFRANPELGEAEEPLQRGPVASSSRASRTSRSAARASRGACRSPGTRTR